MKIINFTVGLLMITFSTQCLLAQSSEMNSEGNSHSEISLNASIFIQQYLSFGSESFFISDPYNINYHHVNDKRIFRAGLGVGFGFINRSDGNSGGNDFDRNSKSISVNLRVGKEFRKSIYKKWQMHYGYDIAMVYGYFSSTTDQISSFKNSNNIMEFGLGPILGVRYNLNEKMTFWTESSYRWYVRRDTNSSYIDGVEEDSQKVTTIGSRFSVPISIYVGMKI